MLPTNSMVLKGLTINCLPGQVIWKRTFQCSSVNCDSLKNLRRFTVPNQKSQYEASKIPKELLKDFYGYPMARDPMGTRHPGYWIKGKFHYVKEMEPELVVPDLTGFELKPYVSYKTPVIKADEFTAEDLFKQTYGNVIIEAYMRNERIEINSTEEEAENARLKHQQTGADLFSTSPREMEDLTP